MSCPNENLYEWNENSVWVPSGPASVSRATKTLF